MNFNSEVMMKKGYFACVGFILFLSAFLQAEEFPREHNNNTDIPIVKKEKSVNFDLYVMKGEGHFEVFSSVFMCKINDIGEKG